MFARYHAADDDGLTSQPSEIEVTPSGLRVASATAPHRPVISRRWAHPIDAALGVVSWEGGADGRVVALRVAKGRPGQAWSALFKVCACVCVRGGGVCQLSRSLACTGGIVHFLM